MAQTVPLRLRVAPTANTPAPVASADMSWALWLLVPVAATALAAAWSWLRARPTPEPSTVEAMQAHSEYLDALAQTARSKDRGPHAEPGD